MWTQLVVVIVLVHVGRHAPPKGPVFLLWPFALPLHPPPSPYPLIIAASVGCCVVFGFVFFLSDHISCPLSISPIGVSSLKLSRVV